MTTLLPKNLKQSYWIVLLLALFTTSSFATGIPTGNGADLAGCNGAPSYPTNGINIGGTQPWWEWISDVEINGVTSHSAKEGYKFFDQVGPISLTGGTQANIKLNPGLSYAQYQTNLFWNVFIDYNRDGDFDDAGENIISQSGNQLAIDEMITVPAGITPGCTRLRVTMQRDGYAWPIERFDFGEIEDYLVTLVAGNGGGGTGILTVNNVPDLTITIPQGQTSTPVFCAPPTGSTTCPAGGFSVVQTSGPASGAVLSAGVYTVVFTATDNCGNSETRSATITVLAPSNNNGILTLNPAQNQTAQIPQGQTSSPVVFNAPTGSTTCPTGGLSIVQTAGPASGSALTAGTYTVVYTATDNCGNTQTTSATITVIPAGNTGGGTPVYTTPVGGTQPWFEWIAQVDFASISNPSSKEGYKFFDQVAPAAVNTGSNQTLTITPGLSYPQYITDLYYTAYIDYNRDGDFNDPGEEVLRQNVTSAGVTGSIQIPATASLGTTRLRVILKRDAYATSAEERFDFGETEDYLITIGAGQNNNGVLTLNPAQNQTAQIPQGQTSTPVVFAAPTATTTCPTGGLTVTQTDGPASGSALTAGTYTVVFTASDNCGNSETTSAVITVSPANNGIITLNAPASQTVTIPTGQNTTSVVFPAATGSTTCPTGGLVVTQISGPNSGQLLTAGTYTAVFNATDNCGNSQTASTVFTVVAPNNGTIALQPGTNVTVTAAQGAINAVANFPTPTATTTCPTGGLVVSQTSGLPSGSSFPIGTTTVGFVATDNCGNSETTSLVVTVNPGNGGNTPVYNTPVGGTQPWFEWISQVDFASISNPSSKEGYKFFDQVAPATVNTGSTQTLTVTPGLSWPQYVTDLYYTAYIDYNRDGDFNDPGEEILRQNVTSAGVTETVQIPANATPGTTRLRVVLKRGSYATSAEERFDFGETEDYLINIVGGNNNGILTVVPAPNQSVNIAPGQTTAVVNYPAPVASTTCPLGGLNSVLTSGPASGTALTAGTYDVIYTTTDACGNSETTTTVITVNPPANNGVLTLNGPADQTVTIAQGQAVIQVIFPDAIGSTTCPQGGLTVSQTGGPQSGANLAAGTYNVVFIASDACGNTATSTTVITVLAPAPAVLTLNGPADQNVMIAPGDTSIVVMFPDAIGTTTCAQGGLTVNQVSGPTSGSALTAGVYTVVFEATDACGNLETSTTTITVAAPNNGALTVVAPADQTVQIAPGEMTAPVLFDDPIASTTCPLGGLMVTQTAGPASGTALSAGVYIVEYTITDACGNQEITTTTLTVNAPMNGMLSVNGPANQNVQIAPGDTTAVVNFPDAVAVTSCPLGGLTITQTAGPVSGTALAAGVYTVEFTITDACGNEEITTTTITVVAPMNGMITVVAPADQNVDIAPGEMTATVVFDDPVATTTCPIGGLMVTQTAGPASGTALSAGVYTVEYSITDACGNMEMTTTVITVNAPMNGMITAVAPADQNVDIAPGQMDVVVMFDEPVATTTCPIGGLMINQTAGPASGTALAAGVYTVEYTITDACGNMEVTTTIITVNAPNNGMIDAVAPADQVVEIERGKRDIVVMFDEPVATTTCPLGGLMINQTAGPASGTALAAGVYTIEYTITDDCGNMEVTTTIITVNAPVCALGDSDGDGVCDEDDCKPHDPNLPAAPGTPCNDGNNKTINDKIAADGCSCAGEIDPQVCTYEEENYSDFESGFGYWIDGGIDCRIESGSGWSIVRLGDNNGDHSSTYTNLIDLSGIQEVEIDFDFRFHNLEPGEKLVLEYSLNGGSSYLSSSHEWVCGQNIENSATFNNRIVNIAANFTGQTRFRFRSASSSSLDYIYIDNIVIRKCAPFAGPCNYVDENTFDWESGFGYWNDGGIDCRIESGSTWKVVRLGDNNGVHSSTYTNLINLSGIKDVQLDFDFRFHNLEPGEKLVLEYSLNGGSSYLSSNHEWVCGQNIENTHLFNNRVVNISANFTSQTRFRFRSASSSSLDYIYIDDITIRKCVPYTDPFAGQRPTYRTLDGKLNNFVNPDYGTAGVPFAREIPAQYGDGVGSLAGPDRPSTRHISNLLSDEPQDRRDERLLSGMAYQFGQFLDHDVVLSLGGGEFSPIQVPSYDPIFAGNGIIPFTRSQAIPGVSPREQMNELTAYIDASHIYGTDPIRAEWLRSKVDGKLKVSSGNLLPYNTIDGEFDSPHDPSAPRMERDQERNGTFRILAVAGDFRANEHPNLTSLHLVFVREHNRLCDMFKAQGETDDEIIYQKARKLVGAMMQRIVYEEFLPSFGVSLSPYTGYKPNVRPDVLNTWATAAFRWHTMVENDIILRNDACEGIGAVELPLKTIFSNPLILRQYGAGVLLRGLVFHPQYRTDLKVNNGLRNFLAGQGQGLDIVSINLQRGRDHGLPDYNTVRQYYGQSPASSFGDINSDYEISSRLQKAYGDINDIDLWAGIFAEPLVNGTSLPRTALAIVKKQFEVMRDGDFYFYKNDPFLTSEDNSIIEGSSLADIIVRNTSSRHIPSNIFFKPPCDSEEALEDLRDKEGKPVCTEYGAELLTSCSATSGSLKNVGSYSNHANVRKIKVTLGYAVRIFNTQGESLYYTDDTGCLPADFSAGNITSIQVICLSDDPSTVDCTGFAGALFTTCWSSPLPIFTTGKYTTEQMKSVGLSNDDLEGLRVNNGMQVTLYEHDNFEGASWTYTGPTVVCLPSHQSNKVSSFEAICLSEPNRSNCGFNGVAGAIFPYSSGDSANPGPNDHIGTSLGEGDYNRARLSQMHVDDNDIKKISVNNGYAITLFENDNFQGNYTVYTGDESDLTKTITETRYHIWDVLGLFPYTNTISMDNMTSSIKVRCIEGLSTAPRALSIIDFEAEKDGTRAKLSINHNFSKEATTLVIEKYNGQLGDFEYLEALTVDAAVGSHVYHDKYPRVGDNLYRVLVEYTDGTTEQTETKIVHFDAPPVLLFASQDLEGVELEWVTTILEGDQEFILERRTAGSDWTVIDQVAAPQPSETALTSRYLDENPEVGVNEYRVRLISSLEGRNSNEREVDYLNTEAVVLFPNPATSYVNISLKGFAGHAVDIVVANPLGQVVKTMRIDEATELPVNMNTEDLIEGVHMVNVKAGGATKTIPLVIIKE